MGTNRPSHAASRNHRGSGQGNTWYGTISGTGVVLNVPQSDGTITGARWSIEGAQAILWLRAFRVSGDLDAYWNWHITQQRQRNHLNRYKDGRILAA